MSVDVQKCYDLALKLTKEAGQVVRDGIWEVKKVEIKSCPADLVTETDTKVEELLISGIRAQFPDHKFIGEESSGEQKKLTDDPTWIIDPVDGTLNFVHGNWNVSISVALFVNKVPQLGIVYMPVLDQMFTATRGKGAYLNGRRISVSKETELSRSLIVVEAGTDKSKDKMENALANFSAIIPQVRGTRTIGSAAANMAMVAMGGCDSYFEFGPHVWDFAAGQILVEEAGGVVIDPSGGPFDILSRRMLCASNEQLAKQLTRLIVQFHPKRDDA